MTYAQYKAKRELLALSDAPLEQRVRAIEELDKKFLDSDSVAKAKQQFDESQADISDIGDD